MYVYVVWGPDARWGDGFGPLCYASSEEEAEDVIRDWEEADEEFGLSDCVYWVEVVPVDDLCLPEDVRKRSLEEIVEYLNEIAF